MFCTSESFQTNGSWCIAYSPNPIHVPNIRIILGEMHGIVGRTWCHNYHQHYSISYCSRVTPAVRIYTRHATTCICILVIRDFL